MSTLTSIGAIAIGGIMIILGLIIPEMGAPFVKSGLFYIGSVVAGFGLTSFFGVPTAALGLILLVEGIIEFLLAFITVNVFVASSLYIISGAHVGGFLKGIVNPNFLDRGR